MSPNEIHFTYKNYRGEVSRRRIRPSEIQIRFGSSEFHTEPQLLMLAYDLDKMAFREFAVRDIDWRAEVDIEMDRWFDEETQVTWTRPTAYAYAMVCKARDKWQEEAKQWDTNVESLLSDGDDSDVVRVCEGGGPEDLKMSLVVSFMKTRKMRDNALMHVGELVMHIAEMQQTARDLFLDAWNERGFLGIMKRSTNPDTEVTPRTITSTVAKVQAFIRSHTRSPVDVETKETA